MPDMIALQQCPALPIYTASLLPSILVGTATTYADNDVIGTASAGIFELPNAVRTNGGTGTLQSVLFADLAAQSQQLLCCVFGTQPTAGTYTNDSNVNWGTGEADAHLVQAVANAAAANWLTINGVTYNVVPVNQPVKAAAGSNSLWALVVSKGTPTLTALSLKLTFGILAD